MNITSISSSQVATAYQSQSKTTSETTSTTTNETTQSSSDGGVVYEPNQALIDKLKNDTARKFYTSIM